MMKRVDSLLVIFAKSRSIMYYVCMYVVETNKGVELCVVNMVEVHALIHQVNHYIMVAQ